MNNTAVSINQQFRLIFWRVIAQVTGMAIKNQKLVERALWMTPIVIVAMLAYLLGRVFGSLLLWGFT